MRIVRRFIHFWYDFVVGDDWTIAVAVIVALLLTTFLVRAQLPAWWLLPVAVLAFLGASLLRASRSS